MAQHQHPVKQKKRRAAKMLPDEKTTPPTTGTFKCDDIIGSLP
ncbi:MAG: hypothetical protein ACOVSW_03495 [Candidatus Kapaibacteriota bacterium]